MFLDKTNISTESTPRVSEGPVPCVFRDYVVGLRLPLDPLKNQIDSLCLLRIRKRHSSPYPPPLLHTAAAATGSGVHRLECRMSAHRGLPSVINRNRRREFFPHKIRRVTPNSFHPHTLNILPIPSRQRKATAELRSPQPLKRFIKCHDADIAKSHPLCTQGAEFEISPRPALFSAFQYRLAACVTDTSTPGMAAMAAANCSAKYTERCCPPVQPNAT